LSDFVLPPTPEALLGTLVYGGVSEGCQQLTTKSLVKPKQQASVPS
jgi:hypothetical protein